MDSTTRNRVLVFIDWYLPGYKAGGLVRSMANMAAHLKETHEFWFVTRNHEYCDPTPYSGTIPDAWNEAPDGSKIWYCSPGSINPRLWFKLLRDSGAEVVYLNGIYSPWFSVMPLLLFHNKSSVRIILASGGMLGNGAIRLKAWKKKPFLLLMKLLGAYRNVVWHATSPIEKGEILNRIGRDATVSVVSAFPPDFDPVPVFKPMLKETGSLKLCFISRVSRKKNLDYALKVLLKVPGDYRICFDVFGPLDDHAYWTYCQQLSRQLPENITFNYRGVVPGKEVIPVFERYHALLFPTWHENFGHVIFECLIAGRPVIISSHTPWQGLERDKAGWNLSLNDEVQFIDSIVQLSKMNQEIFDVWCRGAFAAGQKSLDNNTLVRAYTAMFGDRTEPSV
jgi:glycosyltransferase involved in cell wall biosynthesis